MDEKPTKRGTVVLDELDGQILAAQHANPDITTRELGKLVGLSHVSVIARLRKINKSEPIQDAIRRIAALTPLASVVYEDILTSENHPDRLTAARDVLRGRGVLQEHNKNENRNGVPTPAEVIAAMSGQWTEADHDEFRRLCIASKSGDDGEAQSVDDVAGGEPSPDASQRAA